MNYGFKIISTEDIADEHGRIMPGHVLYQSDDEDVQDTEEAAREYAEAVANGLDGSPAFKAALETAVVELNTAG